MNRLLSVAGVGALAGFCVLWWPASLLLGGLGLLGLALIRKANQRGRDQ